MSQTRSNRDRLRKRSKLRRFLRCENLEARRVLAATAGVFENCSTDCTSKNITEIIGGSLIAGRENEMDIQSFSFGFNRTAPINTGGSPGVPSISGLTFIKDFDRATPDLVEESVLGKRHDRLQFSVFGDSGQTSPEISLNLDDVAITGFSTFEEEGSNEIREDVSVTFTGIEFGYAGVDSKGMQTPQQHASWDLLTNKVDSTNAAVQSAPVTEGLSLTFGSTEIPIDSFDWGVDESDILNGDSVIPEIRIVRPVDESTPFLFAAAADDFLTNTITLRNQTLINGKSENTLQWTLSDPLITSFDVFVDDVQQEASNAISIRFSKIEAKHAKFNAVGAVSGTSDFAWKVGQTSFNGGLSSTDIDPEDGINILKLGDAELEFDSLNWGVQAEFVSSDVEPITFTAPLDIRTPELLATLAKKTTFPTAEIIRPFDAINDEAHVWTLDNATIAKVSIEGTDDPGEDSRLVFELEFDKASLAFDLATGKDVESGWDFGANQSTGSGGFGGAVLNSPELELTITQDGIASDIALEGFNIDVENNGGVYPVDEFYFAATSGLHSPGLFHAVASGELIDKATISRWQDFGKARVETYRWELENFILTEFTGSYGSSLLVNEDEFRVEFPSSTTTLQLTAFDYDSSGSLLGSNTVTWSEGKASFGTVPANKIGSDLGFKDADRTENRIQSAKLVGIGERQIDAYSWSANNTSSHKTEKAEAKAGVATAEDLSLTWRSGPSPNLLWHTLKGVIIPDASVSSTSNFQAYSDIDMKEVQVRGFEFADTRGGELPQNQIDLSFANAKIQSTTIGDAAKAGLRPKFEWDIAANDPSEVSFGSSTFDPSELPDHVLTFPNGSQLKVNAFEWSTQHTVVQDVGTGIVGERDDNVSREVFELFADLDGSTPGLLGTLVSGEQFAELTLASFETPPGSNTPRVYREWKLENVFVDQYGINVSDVPGAVSASLNIGKITSTITTYDDAGGAEGEAFSALVERQGASRRFDSLGSPANSPTASAMSLTNAASDAEGELLMTTTTSTSFTNSVDYISAPIPFGIQDLQTTNANDVILNLPNLFSDEQEDTADLTYSFTLDSDPSGVLDTTTLDVNNVLTLDVNAVATGTATLTVSAEDSFGNIGSRTFDLVVSDQGGFLNVNTNLDVVSVSDGLTSLREAIAYANDPAAGNLGTGDADNDGNANDTITFDLPDETTIALDHPDGQLVINTPVTIDGPGANLLSVDALAQGRVFSLGSPNAATYQIRGVTLTGGEVPRAPDPAPEEGGIIRLNDSDDTLILDGVTIDGGKANAGGGVAVQAGADYQVLNSTFKNNLANFSGSALFVGGSSDGLVANSTFYGNTSGSGSGALMQQTGGTESANMRVVNSTIVFNTGVGVQLFSFTGGSSTAEIGNSILAINSGANAAAGGSVASVVSLGGNVSDDGTAQFNQPNDQINTNPLISGLGTGGPTDVFSVAPGSPAIDAGDNALAVDANMIPLATDQRGGDFQRIFGNSVDAGAFESQILRVTQLADENDASDLDYSTFDPDDLSLREAITLANSTSVVETIAFDFAGSGPFVMNVSSQLPFVTAQVIIDGTSQSGFAGTPIVQLNAVGTVNDGLRLQGHFESTIRGLSITGFANDGIEIAFGSLHNVTGNWLGLDPNENAVGNLFGLKLGTASGANTVSSNVISGNTGTGIFARADSSGNIINNNRIGTNAGGNAARPNGGAGINLLSTTNYILNNQLSGNARQGLLLSGDNNTVQGNFVGTDLFGTFAIPNGAFGILSQSNGNTIGGPFLGQGNLISGNFRQGLILNGANDNTIEGNKIGTDVTGTSAIPNTSYGIYVLNSDDNVIGGDAIDAANLVSGNGGSGVAFARSSGNTLFQNKIGTDLTGQTAVPNSAIGVFLLADASDNVIAENQISGNSATGVAIIGGDTRGNEITGNSIGSNADFTGTLPNGQFAVLVSAPDNTIVNNSLLGSPRGLVFSEASSTGNLASSNLINTPTGVQFAKGASGNTVGPANDFSFNDTGVRFLNNSGSENRITQNSFSGIGTIAIDFAGLGPTANDANDADEFPNRGQNHPELLTAEIIGDDLSVTFQVPTPTAAATYDLTIEFFNGFSPNDAQLFLGSTSYTAADFATGFVTKLIPDAGALVIPGAPFIVATATDAAGNTSELSASIPIGLPAAAAQASRSPLDTNADGRVSALDALMILNLLDDPSEGEQTGRHHLRGDANGDGQVTALDALKVINWINSQSKHDTDQEIHLFLSQVDAVFAAADLGDEDPSEATNSLLF